MECTICGKDHNYPTCPFCGGDGKVVHLAADNGHKIYLKCEPCEILVPERTWMKRV